MEHTRLYHYHRQHSNLAALVQCFAIYKDIQAPPSSRAPKTHKQKQRYIFFSIAYRNLYRVEISTVDAVQCVSEHHKHPGGELGLL